MHAFPRGEEPRELTAFRTAKRQAEGRELATVGWNELDTETKSALRDSLAKQQGYLCAYCASRIWPTSEGMRIEHWDPQHAAPAKRFEWDNLLGVCNGGGKGHPSHCDERRGELAPAEQTLSLKPDRDQHRIASLLEYAAGADGLRIRAPTDADAHRDVDITLALNTPRLASNRSAALKGIRQRVHDHFRGSLVTRSFLDGLTRPTASRGYLVLEPFLPAIRAAIERWGQKASG